MATTQCDIIRDFAAAWDCGLCSTRPCTGSSDCAAGQSCSGGVCVGRPSSCPATLPTALCAVPDAANKKMLLFADQYNPVNLVQSGVSKASLVQEEKNLLSGIEADEASLAAAYPSAPPGAASIGWQDFNYCLWAPSGARGGVFNNKYFERNDAQGFGMNPVYPIGGTFAQGSIWKYPAASPVPLSVDYVMNPDLAVIIIFFVLVVIFAILVFRASQGPAKTPRGEKKRADLRQKLEAADPYRGSAFESYPDPLAKCREYVESMEAQGFSADYYRRSCGLPPKAK